jgi:hypothetical protein
VNIVNKYQLPSGNSGNKNKHQLPIGTVDEIVEELCKEYSNPYYRRWYCGVIYEFGPSVVEEWRRRACEGKEPAKLFSKYVKDTRTYRGFVRTKGKS